VHPRSWDSSVLFLTSAILFGGRNCWHHSGGNYKYIQEGFILSALACWHASEFKFKFDI